jgi:hypothetical protein
MKPFLLTIAFSLVFTLPGFAQELASEDSVFLEELKPLVLPDNPTREQAETYVKEHVRILESTKNYPRANRLAREINLEKRMDAIPNRDIDLLFEQADEFILVRAHFARVIEKRHPKAYKAIVIAGLYDHPDNIIAIKHHGWYQDAKEPILRKLEDSNAMPPLAWWQAFTEVAEPKHYAKLKQLFLSEDFYIIDYKQYLEILPGYDIADTTRANVLAIDQKIEEINARIRFGCANSQRFYRRTEMAAAAQLGDVEILGRLIDELDDPDDRQRIWFYTSNRIDTWRNYVTRVIDFKGSNKEIREWYEANRDDLVFDNFTKRFIIEEDF